MFQNGIDMPPSQCPTCMKILTRTAAEDDSGGPAKGDMTVCLHCGEILVFSESLKLSPVKIEALENLKVLQPETHAMLMAMSIYVVSRNSAN